MSYPPQTPFFRSRMSLRQVVNPVSTLDQAVDIAIHGIACLTEGGGDQKWNSISFSDGALFDLGTRMEDLAHLCLGLTILIREESAKQCHKTVKELTLQINWKPWKTFFFF